MHVALQIIGLTALLYLAQAAIRRASKWVSWSLFLLVPLALTPYWIRVNDFEFFMWVKLYTVCFCVSWGTLLRFTSLGERPWARATIPLLLGLNIVEATMHDMLGHGLAHTLNAIAGVLLIVTVPFGSARTTIDSGSRSRDMLSGTSRGWILGYMLWNWTFVYLNYPSLAGHHTAVLASALIVGLIDPRRWTQTRAYTLGLSLLFTATAYSDMVSWMDTANWFDERVALVAAGIALGFVAARCLLQIGRVSPVNATETDPVSRLQPE